MDFFNGEQLEELKLSMKALGLPASIKGFGDATVLVNVYWRCHKIFIKYGELVKSF